MTTTSLIIYFAKIIDAILCFLRLLQFFLHLSPIQHYTPFATQSVNDVIYYISGIHYPPSHLPPP